LYLLSKGASVNVQNEEGWSPLHAAASEGHLDIVKEMVSKFNAQVDIQNDAGTTPLFQAASSGRVETCKYLIEKGKDLPNDV
jgi:ankyrin repeat protein